MHSPLPLPLEINAWNGDSEQPRYEISGKDDMFWVAGVGPVSDDPEKALSYAQQIVRACNAYPKLLGALKLAQKREHECHCLRPDLIIDLPCTTQCQKARALLAELEGGE